MDDREGEGRGWVGVGKQGEGWARGISPDLFFGYMRRCRGVTRGVRHSGRRRRLSVHRPPGNSQGVRKAMPPSVQVLDNPRRSRRAETASGGEGMGSKSGVGERVEREGAGAAGGVIARVEQTCVIPGEGG